MDRVDSNVYRANTILHLTNMTGHGGKNSLSTQEVRCVASKWECLPGARPACYLCIKYLISSPKFILTWGSPPRRPH